MDKAKLDYIRKNPCAIDYEDIIALLDHIDALEERLFGALQTDKVLEIAVREVDHASRMSRSVVSDVIDLACVQKARIDALEGIVKNLAAPIYSDEKAFALTRHLHRANPNWAAEQLHDFALRAKAAIASAVEGKNTSSEKSAFDTLPDDFETGDY